eukprot:TRINITY_DN4573_c0_g1_i2.p1 TRINITY_DN4573_c0_g1~~TRINITY_DN4573_c0_g1_i2.p1  ORF type:complete len:132 (+),score=28.25 TRINITY_DN4573_c0_g1_i2:365-760(+)
MLVYLLLAKPYEDMINNVVNVYNELVIMACFLSVLMMNVVNFNELTTSLWGWGLIALILVSLLSIWAITVPGMVSAACKFFKLQEKDKSTDTSHKESTKSSTKLVSDLLVKSSPAHKLKGNNSLQQVSGKG